MAAKYFIGIDVGGTNLRAAIVNGDGKVVDRKSILTRNHGNNEAVLGDILDLVNNLIVEANMRLDKISAIGIGFPGAVDSKLGVICFSHTFPQFKLFPAGEFVSRRFGLPARVLNDANAAAWGEFTVGAGRYYKDILCVTLGTGVGGGLILKGELHFGNHNCAGEIGHMVLFPNGHKCHCGSIGCLERYVGAKYIVEKTKSILEKRRESPVLKTSAMFPLSPKTIAEAAQTGDSVFKSIWDETGRNIGITLAGIMNFIDLELIIIGGNIAEAGECLFNPIRDSFREHLYGRQSGWLLDRAKIVKAFLGPDAGLIGAAMWAKR